MDVRTPEPSPDPTRGALQFPLPNSSKTRTEIEKDGQGRSATCLFSSLPPGRSTDSTDICKWEEWGAGGPRLVSFTVQGALLAPDRPKHWQHTHLKTLKRERWLNPVHASDWFSRKTAFETSFETWREWGTRDDRRLSGGRVGVCPWCVVSAMSNHTKKVSFLLLF